MQRALALHQQGKLDGAENLYRDALVEDASDRDALLGLSVLLTRTGRAAAAIELLTHAHEETTDQAELLTSLAEAQVACGRQRDARLALERAIVLAPLADAYFKLGELLEQLEEPENALACYTDATGLKPEAALFQLRLADVLWSAGHRERSLGHYQAAVNAEPRSLPALIGLAQALQALGLHEGAITISDRALALDADNVLGLAVKAFALLARERFAEAARCFRCALARQPGYFSAEFGYSGALFKTGEIVEAVASVRRALAIRADLVAHSNLLFQLPFQPGVGPHEILAEARAFAAQWADPVAGPELPPQPDLDRERRLRVGYVSADFRDHCQAFYMLPLLAAHDRSRVEVICYASVARPDALTERLKAQADLWRDVARFDDRALAELIRADRIDVLIDLTMHMANGRLLVFARRPAPVQISWLAYPGTTGLSQIDYRVTDRHIDPPQGASQLVEALVFPRLEQNPLYGECSLVLPDTFWCYDALSDARVSQLPALTNGYVTFGCLGNPAKVNPAVVALWSRVLAALPTSRLLLRVPSGEPRRRLAEEFRQSGVELARLEFVDRQARASYLETYQRIDLCLDTLPYNGHTTSLDAHWMGVPVITRVGETVVGRAGLCQARNLDLPFLIAQDDDAFVRNAVDLATDLTRLSQLRADLRGRMKRSPLTDATRFSANLERAYRLAWCAYCDAQNTAGTRP